MRHHGPMSEVADDNSALRPGKPRAWSAVVLYFQSPGTINRTVRLLLEQEPPPEEVVVVDNASHDNLKGRLTPEFGTRVSLVTCAINVGYAAGMNIGRQALQGSPCALLFATHEVQLDPGCAKELVNGVVEHGLMITGPTLLLPTGQVWSRGGQVGWAGNSKHLKGAASSPVHFCQWIDGAVVMVDLAAFDALGGYDPAYFLYWEDVDLGLRANAERAHSVGCVTAATAIQDTKMAPERLNVRNRLWVWRCHGQAVRVALSVIDVVGRVVIRDVLGLRWSVARERIHGLIDGLRLRPGSGGPQTTRYAVYRPDGGRSISE